MAPEVQMPVTQEAAIVREQPVSCSIVNNVQSQESNNPSASGNSAVPHTPSPPRGNINYAMEDSSNITLADGNLPPVQVTNGLITPVAL